MEVWWHPRRYLVKNDVAYASLILVKQRRTDKRSGLACECMASKIKLLYPAWGTLLYVLRVFVLEGHCNIVNQRRTGKRSGLPAAVSLCEAGFRS